MSDYEPVVGDRVVTGLGSVGTVAEVSPCPVGASAVVEYDRGGRGAWMAWALRPVAESRVRLADIAAMVDPAKAQRAIADVMACLGMSSEWDAETIEYVASAASRAFPEGLPSVFDQDDAAVSFWSSLDYS